MIVCGIKKLGIKLIANTGLDFAGRFGTGWEDSRSYRIEGLRVRRWVDR